MIPRKIIVVSRNLIGTSTLINRIPTIRNRTITTTIKRTAQNPLGGYGYSDFGYKPKPFPLVSKLFHLFISSVFLICILDWKQLVGYDLFDALDPEWMKRQREQEEALMKMIKEEEEREQQEKK